MPFDVRRWMLSALVPSALSAGSLVGLVSDPGGTPVAGATVEIAAIGVIASSDDSGAYRLDGVPEGDHRVQARAEGFEAVGRRVSVVDAGPTELNLKFVSLRRTWTSIEVVGRAEDAVAEIPGSVHVISSEELSISRPFDANEVLKRSPGITLREDSGPAAMRLNVGIRGLNPDRSRKVLMLEDGIPIALAPYGEPEMYYSPPIDRMERVEILKGSGQIVHGPQTVGGVINFVTPDPPAGRLHGDFDFQGGQRGQFVGQGALGGANRDQSLGWSTRYLHKESDGWRSFWYDIDDFQGKFTYKPSDRHTFALKGGFYDERSNSTYLGLTQPMFDLDPNLNAVPGDELRVRRESGSLSHAYVASPNAIWNSSFFSYHTKRNWRRQDWDRADLGKNYLDVVGDPSIPGGAVFLLDSTGNRNREFNVTGVQTGMSVNHEAGGTRQKFDFGVRYVNERANDKRINGESFRANDGVLRDNENRFGDAFAAFIQDRIHLGGRVIVTPGLRLEVYNQDRHILRQRVRTPEGNIPTDVDIRRDNDVTKLIPGLGVSVKATEHVSFFAGVHRGFSPPTTKIAIDRAGENLDLDAELSWNYEAGVRFGGSRALRGEVTYFRMDFSNQIIPAAQSGGATTTLVNGGASLHEGFESSFRVDWNEVVDLGGWSLYSDVRHMRLATARFSRNNLFAGNRLPYAPGNTLGLLVGARQRRGLGFQIDMSYIDEQFGDNEQTREGSADGTVGALPSYKVFNLVFDYSIERERLKITPYFTVKNLFNEIYIASRAPEGIQPGLFRQANFGVKFSF